MRRIMLLAIALIALLTFAACSQEEQEVSEEVDFEDSPFDDEEIVFEEPIEEDLPEVVAIVNGDEIYASEIMSFQQELAAQNFEASLDEVVSEIISKKLIAQEARDRGFEVAREDVEEIFESQGHDVDELKTLVEADGLVYEEFLESQFDDLLFMRMLEEEMDSIIVGDEEVRALYDEQIAMLPDNELTFEEVEDDLRESVAQQQALFELSALSASLMENASIETFY